MIKLLRYRMREHYGLSRGDLRRLSKILLRSESLLLLGILLLAFFLRLLGIGFGLPYEYHVDEVQYVRQAAAMGSRGLEPVWWNNPPFYKYMLLAEYGSLYLIGRILGWYASVSDFGDKLMVNPVPLYLLARGTTALFGTLTVLFTYLTGKTAHGRKVGVLSAFFLAVCFLHVRDSHFAVNDIPLTFFVTIVLWAALRIAESGKIKWYALAGGALGIGFATKYSAVLVASPIVVAHFFSPNLRYAKGDRLWKPLMVAVSMAVGIAVLGSPYFILTPGKVIHEAYEALYLAGRQGFEGWQIDPAGGFIFYLKTLYWGMGLGLLFTSLFGLCAATLSFLPQDVILASFILTSYTFWGQQDMYFARFVIPLIPPLLVFAALLVKKVGSGLSRTSEKARIVMLSMALFLTVQPLVSSLRLGYLWKQADTRTLARQWIEQHVPEGTRIAVDWRTHTPPLSIADQPAVAGRREYDVLIVGGEGLSEYSLQWYQDQGYRYLIATSFIYEISLADKTENAKRKTFYTTLDKELELIKVWRPYHGDIQPRFHFDQIYGPLNDLFMFERPGPTLKLYAIQ